MQRAAAQPRHVHSVGDQPPLADRNKPVDRAQKGGFAGAGGADHRHHLAARDREGDAVDRHDIAEADGQTIDLDRGRREGLHAPAYAAHVSD